MSPTLSLSSAVAESRANRATRAEFSAWSSGWSGRIGSDWRGSRWSWTKSGSGAIHPEQNGSVDDSSPAGTEIRFSVYFNMVSH